MSKFDQQKFIKAVAEADSAWLLPDWDDAVDALSVLSMPDMLQALAAITDDQLGTVYKHATYNVLDLGHLKFNRIDFACNVVRNRGIVDNGIPLDQVNDGREFLGCTRLDDKGVQCEIDRATRRGHGFRPEKRDPNGCIYRRPCSNVAVPFSSPGPLF
jgi:hypothetical protein